MSNHLHRTAVRKASDKSVDYSAKNAARKIAKRDKPKPVQPRRTRTRFGAV